MKKLWIWLALAGILLTMGIVPLQATDAAELQPARLILLWKEQGLVHARCDTGAEGSGANLELALRDMMRTAQGALFLDTADHILVQGARQELLAQAAQTGMLRPAANVVVLEGELPDCKQAVEFFRSRKSSVSLGRLRAALLGAGEVSLPRLIHNDGRMMLVGA